MTRSDQCYTLNFLGVKEGEKCVEKGAIDRGEGPKNEPIIETKANEFLNFIKHNECNIVE